MFSEWLKHYEVFKPNFRQLGTKIPCSLWNRFHAFHNRTGIKKEVLYQTALEIGLNYLESK